MRTMFNFTIFICTREKYRKWKNNVLKLHFRKALNLKNQKYNWVFFAQKVNYIWYQRHSCKSGSNIKTSSDALNPVAICLDLYDIYFILTVCIDMLRVIWFDSTLQFGEAFKKPFFREINISLFLGKRRGHVHTTTFL